MTIAFVGLGKMGKPMAMNLAQKSGAKLTVYDVVTSSFAEFEANGVAVTTNLAAVAQAEIVFLSLPNSKIVEAVVDGLAEHGKARQLIVDLSTITYASTRNIAEKLQKNGIRFVDAPVSGMEARAIDGTLTVMCGGDEADFQEAKPFLACIASKILYMGDHGSGQLTKLINQLLFDINAAALAEILPLSAKMGLDSEKIGEVINSGTGRSYASEFFIPRDLEGIFDEGYPMAHAYKDLVSAVQLGSEKGIPMPVLSAAIVTYQMALLHGTGGEGKGAMIKVYEDMLNVQFRKKR